MNEIEGTINHLKGLQSEEIVYEALNGTGMVKVIEKVHYSGFDDDATDVDLRVVLDHDRYPELVIDGVCIQVKSSSRSVERFRKKVARRFGLDHGEVEDWLRRKRIVVLNGQDPQLKINQDFSRQVQAINNLWTKSNK